MKKPKKSEQETCDVYFRIRTFDEVRAFVQKIDEKSALLKQEQGTAPCDCGAKYDAALSALSVEQLKGLAIGLDLTWMEFMPSLFLGGKDSPLQHPAHKIIHAQRSAVKLVSAKENSDA